ncbi:hypothetical protein [Prochlorococcus sp. MIT 1300]|uniref:hypothetical protein n=1 Tax=Prochlorococcus sp. MIT 1300 TaxID=3096218 RepID=UPI002A74F700|nr:hypothetical protein [Prochlorococcus sp. MIT 1300]
MPLGRHPNHTFEMQLTQNKLTWFALNVVFCVLWLFVGGFLSGMIMVGGISLPSTAWIPLWLQYLIVVIPMVFATRQIWCVQLKTKTTWSRQEKLAGKKWDAVVEELRNRK